MVRVAADEGKRFIDAACEAHAMVDDWSMESNSGGQQLKVKFNVLAATDRGQVGKSLSEFFPLEGKAVGKTWDLIEAVRLVARGADRTQPLEFNEGLLKGRQCCLKIHLEQGQTKNAVTGQYQDDPSKPIYARLGFGAIFDTHDPKTAHVPKDQQFLGMWGQGQGGQGGSGQQSPPTQQQPQTPSAGQQGGNVDLGSW